MSRAGHRALVLTNTCGDSSAFGGAQRGPRCVRFASDSLDEFVGTPRRLVCVVGNSRARALENPCFWSAVPPRAGLGRYSGESDAIAYLFPRGNYIDAIAAI